MGCVLNESGIDVAECCRKVPNGRKVAGAIRPLVKSWVCSLIVQGCCMRHCSYVLLYGNETMIYREKGRSGIRAVQMGNLRGLLCIMMMDRVVNARIRELYGEAKVLSY